jgi:hypothetical protein
LVGEEGEAVADGADTDEAHRLLVASLAEEALTCPENERMGHQPQLVDQVVLHQRLHERAAAVDEDVPIHGLLQLRDLLDDVALQDDRVGPSGGSSRVEDMTYLGTLRSLSAHSPGRSAHRSANQL